MCPGSCRSRSNCALNGIFEPQGAVPQALNLLGGAGFITWRLRRHLLGKYRRGIIGAAGRVRTTALRLDPRRKGLVPYLSRWWDGRQISLDHPLLPAEAFQSGICAGRSKLNGRLVAKRPPASAGPLFGRRAASLTSLSHLYCTGPCCPV